MPTPKRRTPYDAKLLNRKLAAALEANGEPNQVVAQRAGIRPSTLSMILHGQHAPRLTTIRAIAAALDSTPDLVGLGKKGGVR